MSIFARILAAAVSPQGIYSVLACGKSPTAVVTDTPGFSTQPDGKELDGFYKPKPNHRFLDGVAGTRARWKSVMRDHGYA